MKRKILLLLTFVLLSSAANLAHNQYVHQYITSQAYFLLKKSLNVDITEMLAHLENGPVGPPWSNGTLLAGAWREDEEDIVYGYSKINPPTLTGITGSVYDFTTAFGGLNPDGFVSSTHFWYADDGDALKTTMTAGIRLPHTWWDNVVTFTIPNAYQKMMNFVNGNFDLRIQLIIRDFPNGNGTPCAEQWAWVNFKYFYLPNYFNSRILYVSKIEWHDGSVTNYPNLPTFKESHYSLLNGVPYNQFKENICWEILGRMCHLLQDMSVPAHANVDPHGGNPDLRIDNFENNFGDIGWTANMVYNIEPNVLNPYISSDPIHFLMYTSQQQANHFASNGPHMYPNNDIFGGNSLSEEITYLNSLGINNYGEPTVMTEITPPAIVENMKNKLFPEIIRATASLLYWFACETGLINKITFKNNFNAGTIQFDQEILQSGSSKDLFSGDNHVLTAIPQPYNNLDYIWNTYAPNARSVWSKLDRDGIPVTINNNLNITYNLNVTSQDKDATYTAGLRKNFKISRNDQTEFDGTIAMADVTRIVEQNSGTVPAPSTKTVGSRTYSFAGWANGGDGTFIPTNNMAYPNNALYKMPTKSNTSTAFANNSQRKFVRTPNGTLHMVYESMGHVWYEISTDNGQNWILMNNGLPMDNDRGKCPSIDFGMVGENIFVVILYQEFEAPFDKLKAAVYKSPFGFQPFQLFETETILTFLNPSGHSLNPVISIDYSGYTTIVWQITTEGLYFRSAGLLIDGLHLIGSNTRLAGTTGNSKNPSIATSKFANGSQVKHLVWEENDAIKYSAFYSAPPGTIKTLSTYSGYTKNYMPTLAILNDDLARIAWIGERTEAEEERIEKSTAAGTVSKRTIFRGINNDNYFWNFGSSVTSASVQSTGDNNYYIVWSGSGGTSMVSNYTAFNPVKSLSTSGNQVHVASGSTTSNTCNDV